MSLSCFELGERMLSMEEARAAILDLVAGPLPAEAVDLADLHGRVLADTVASSIDVPQCTNAAMDGIALRWPEEGDRPKSWRRIGDVRAGQRFPAALGVMECLGITTGAPLPVGADTVIMREQLTMDADGGVVVARPERVHRGQNVRLAGEDIRRGKVVLDRGTRISAAELGLLASLGLASARVHRRPRVAIFSTGDEVTPPGRPLPEAAVYDANRFTLRGMIAEHGGEVLDLGILPDDRDLLAVALGEAAESADLVITSGGVSVGEADFTRAALATIGELGFWRIAIRPGRPLACGRLGPTATPFLGLPGNPVAVMVTFLEFVVPLLARLQGRADISPVRLRARTDHAMPSRMGRVDFLRGIHYGDEEGVLRVGSTGDQGSGILTSMVMANCLIEIAADRDHVARDDTVAILPLSRLP